MPKQRASNILILVLTIVFFCLDFYFRMSPSLVVPQLMQQFNITPIGMSVFASLFFCGYLLMQIPAGLVLQKCNVRLVLFVTMLLCPLSFIGFIFSQHLYIAYGLRFITGLTAAFSFISVIYVAQEYFSQKWFGFISGLAIAAGTLASSFFQILTSQLMQTHTWMFAINTFAFIGIAASFVLLFFKLKPMHALPEDSNLSLGQQIKTLFTSKYIWINGLIGGLFYLPTSIYDALWGIPFTEHYYALTKTASATGVTMLFIGWAVGSPIFGFYSAYIKKVTSIILVTSALAVIFSLIFIYVNLQSISYVYVMLFLIGVCSGAQVLVWRLFTGICPNQIRGIGIAFTNMFIMGVVAIFHFITGLLLDTQTQQINFKLGLMILPIAFTLTFLLSVVLRVGAKR